MPQTLYDADGNEKEVLTDEEVEALKNPSTALKEVMTELGLEVGDNINDKLDDFKTRVKELKDAESPNWKAARQKMASLESVIANLKKEGKSIDNDGNIIENKDLTPEEIEKKAQLAARQELIQEKMEDELDGIEEEKKKVVLHYFKKLSAGEELTTRNVTNYLKEAKKLAEVDSKDDIVKNSINRIGSSYSNPGSGDKGFAETERGKAISEMMGLPKIEDKK